MNVVSELSEILVDRHLRGHRPPLVVLAHDCWLPQLMQSDVDLVAKNPAIWDRMPTAGDRYLAELIEQEYLTTIVQFGVSNSLERAIAARVPPGRYLRLVRGEQSDEYIERALQFDEPKTRMLKLRGDIIGRSAGRLKNATAFTSGLRNSLRAMARSSDLIWIGPICTGPDVDAILRSDVDVIWLASESPRDSSADSRLSSCRNIVTIDGPAAAYDTFLRDLALQTSRLALKPIMGESARRMHDQVRSKAPTDIAYADELIKELAQKIRSKCADWQQPTLLVYIHDPDAPGGSEVGKRMHRYLPSRDNTVPESVQIVVQGTRIRWMDRQAKPIPPGQSRSDFQNVVIIDSVSFTGRTLRLAADHVSALWPDAEVYYAVLVAFQDLLKSSALSDTPPDHLIKVATTDHPDIFFPWGWTQATSAIVRHLRLYDRVHNVTITQRPWGTAEVLADQSQCIVRLLSIRAGHRLSYQSHAVRDLIFIAVDGDIGFEFDSDDDEDVVDAALLAQGEYVAVPRGVRYRFAAHRNTARLLEIGFGLYDQVFDIERFSDDYGRVGKLGDV